MTDMEQAWENLTPLVIHIARAEMLPPVAPNPEVDAMIEARLAAAKKDPEFVEYERKHFAFMEVLENCQFLR